MENETPEIPTETKEDLEKEKLRLEIAELNKAWWKKPAYIAALFPTILALTALIYGLANGYFQASFVKLENQTHAVQVRKEQLEKDLAELEEEFRESAEERRIIEERKVELLKRVDEVDILLKDKTKIKEWLQERDSLRQRIKTTSPIILPPIR